MTKRSTHAFTLVALFVLGIPFHPLLRAEEGGSGHYLPGSIASFVDGVTVPAAFTASESFDVGVDLGSNVSRDYFERRPFQFDGRIRKVEVKLK